MATYQDPEHETGVSVSKGGAEAEAVRPRERKANTVVALRLAGYSWEEIAEVEGYPTGRAALVAFEGALEKEVKTSPEQQAKMRDLAGRRLERMLRAVWTKAIDAANPEQMTAQQRALAVIDRHAKLYGLDAPTQFIVSNPTNDDLHAWVSQVMSQGGPVPDEGDIFDAEIIEPEQLEA